MSLTRKRKVMKSYICKTSWKKYRLKVRLLRFVVKFSSFEPRVKLAAFTSLGWVFFWTIVAIVSSKEMNLNEWGDFMAGTSAPLAFFWLVIGYFQQGDELKQNTQALRQQADELRESVKQQEALVDLGREELGLLVRDKEEQHLINKRNAQPRFKCERVTWNRGVLYTTFVNNGGAISKVTIGLDEEEYRMAESPKVNIQPGILPSWEHGESVSFEMSFTERFEGVKPLDLEITYNDFYEDYGCCFMGTIMEYNTRVEGFSQM